MTSRPPKWIKSFLSNFLDERLLESSLGDLEEKYYSNVDNGLQQWRARLRYIVEGLGFIKFASIRKEDSNTTLGQLIHSVVFFARLIRKDKSYYLVSMFGLALSLTSFLFIAMFVVDELSYDSIHANRDRIFRVTTHARVNDVDFDLATSQFPAAQALKSEFPEIEEAVRLHMTTKSVQVDSIRFDERLVFADDNFFKVFSFPLLSGHRETILDEAGTVVLTKSTALKYFGTKNVIGNTIRINNVLTKIVGVMNDIPSQSHMKFDMLMPLSTQLNKWRSESGLEGRENKWFWIGAYTYLMLRQTADEAVLNEKLPDFVKKYFPERYHRSSYELQPLPDIHLISHMGNELEPNGDMLYVRMFTVLAVVIMIVSSINLVNLSYFKINSRLKEVGIRKFLGQNSGKLVLQLSVESLLMGIISFVAALVFCGLFINRFNVIVEKNFELWSVSNIKLISIVLGLILILSIIAVARPALRFSKRLIPVDHSKSKEISRFRNLLIGLQVGFSFVLLVFSFVVADQLDLFRKKDLGFDKSNVIIVSVKEEMNIPGFRVELLKNRSITDVTWGDTPGKGYDGWRFVPEGGSYEQPVMLPLAFVDPHFIQTMRIKLLAGENFNESALSDTAWSFLINKKAAIEFGWTDSVLGRKLEVFAPGRTEILGRGKVIGMIDDYHFESLHDPVKAVVISGGAYGGDMIVRVSEINGETISAIQQAWSQFSKRPFEYSILDQQLERLYVNEVKLGNVILFFTLVAVYLTCYGLFAMSSLVFSSKLKEVAIRKVFGARNGSIMRQFYGKYALFNFVAIVISIPIAMWVGNFWLDSFQYRVELSYLFFLKAAAFILLAGMLSVSYYLAKVAWSNPLRFLRRD